MANLWTQSALEESEPPLIVVVSNNNQAVTNILENFASVDEEGVDDDLRGRWIPEVSSYGLFCCSSGKANDETPYQYLGPNEEGCMGKWQTQHFFDSAKTYFLEKARFRYASSVSDLFQVKTLLHQELKQIYRVLVEGVDNLAEFQRIEHKISTIYGSVDSLFRELSSIKQLRSICKSQQSKMQSQLDELYSLWEDRNFWTQSLTWLPSVRKKVLRRTARLLNRWDYHFDNYSDETVEALFINEIQRYKGELKSIEKKLAELQSLQNSYEGIKINLDCWIDQHRPITLFSQGVADQISEINDRVLRFKLFKLATHYWEALWLLELEEFLSNRESDKKSPRKLRRKLRRFAKLTPCFVSTLYMLPSTFTAFEKQDNVWKDVPLFEEVDLLIIDEAGQALPQVSAVSFAFSKRALIVGDVDQIEPVWDLPVSIDRANLQSFDLLDSEQQYDDFWLQSGLLASSGNVMRVAQRQCFYHQFKKLQRGLYLTEHRRCYDSIISYCNTLVYKGVLEPLRGESKTDVPWGTLSLIPTLEESKKYGASRGNPGEAEQIVKWLVSERKKIINYARGANPKWIYDDAKILKLAVGIVTPFSKQTALIKGELKQEGMAGITVGTVHSLQGDERLLILFSSVYGANDSSLSKFYDRGPNMLNVAVSRAKDAFIVFGNPDVFGSTDSGSPSGLLRSKLACRDCV